MPKWSFNGRIDDDFEFEDDFNVDESYTGFEMILLSVLSNGYTATPAPKPLLSDISANKTLFSKFFIKNIPLIHG